MQISREDKEMLLMAFDAIEGSVDEMQYEIHVLQLKTKQLEEKLEELEKKDK